jgi:hypothetical protein
MSRKSIRKSGPEIVTESAVSFQKEKSGLFKKVETVTQRDIHTSSVIKTDTIESDDRYRQTLEEDFDHEVVYQDIDGSEIRMRLKAIDPDTWQQ